MSQVERDVCPLCGHAERYGMTNDEVDMTKAKRKQKKKRQSRNQKDRKSYVCRGMGVRTVVYHLCVRQSVRQSVS